MSLLLLLRPSGGSGPVNLTATGGTAAATGTNVVLTVAPPAGSGAATAAGTGSTLTVVLAAATGTSTAGGGSSSAFKGVVLDASNGQATANPGTVGLTARWAITSGTGTAGGGTATPFVGVVIKPGKFVLTNAEVRIAGIDVSSRCHTVQMLLEREEIDVTPLNADYREFMPGPAMGTFTISLMHDPAIMTPAFWAAVDSSATIEITPRNVQTQPDNPTWTSTVMATRRTMLQGNVGDRAEAGLELKSTTDVLQLIS